MHALLDRRTIPPELQEIKPTTMRESPHPTDHLSQDLSASSAIFTSAAVAVSHAVTLFKKNIAVRFECIADESIAPYAHWVLAFLKFLEGRRDVPACSHILKIAYRGRISQLS